ncbi:MAG: hypothetical protein JJ872_10575 [Marivivens sp.]|nr:hypothetical protein [Marivivens sp.]
MEDIEKWFAKSARFKRNGYYDDIVESYLSLKLSSDPFPIARADEIARSLIVNGVPRTHFGKLAVGWKVGLGSFCSPHDNSVIGELAATHADSLLQLYQRWLDVEDELDFPKYGSKVDCELSPKQRGALLSPSLQIDERERLSDRYISDVLRPYGMARYLMHKAFFNQIEVAHREGHWIGFTLTETGSPQIIVPGQGFDGRGRYSIDRGTYLKGFGFSDQDFPLANFPDRPRHTNQSSWLFIGSEQWGVISDILFDGRIAQSSGADNKKPAVLGRPHGRGYQAGDRLFVKMIVDLVRSGQKPSIHAATLDVVNVSGDEIAGASVEAKIARLRKRAARVLKET